MENTKKGNSNVRCLGMKKLALVLGAIAIIPFTLASCSVQNSTKTQAADTEIGTLALVANGEDFIRQGFVSKDGWQINFDHAYVTLNQVKAYSTEPAFEAAKETKIQPKQTVFLLNQATTIDLAEATENAEPIFVTQAKAPIGAYNALGWQLVAAPQGLTQGYSIVLSGKAHQKNQAIDFVLSFDRELKYICGEYVGEHRKGILQEASIAQVETTFHFDHIFGDGSLPPEDDLNLAAIGFTPLASLAKNGRLNVNQQDLSQKLAPKDYHKLEQAISDLGHVGEGHCRYQSN